MTRLYFLKIFQINSTRLRMILCCPWHSQNFLRIEMDLVIHSLSHSCKYLYTFHSPQVKSAALLCFQVWFFIACIQTPPKKNLEINYFEHLQVKALPVILFVTFQEQNKIPKRRRDNQRFFTHFLN